MSTICLKCGRELKLGAVFCGGCGASQQAVQAQGAGGNQSQDQQLMSLFIGAFGIVLGLWFSQIFISYVPLYIAWLGLGAVSINFAVKTKRCIGRWNGRLRAGLVTGIVSVLLGFSVFIEAFLTR